jgi:hypothetical protein
MPFYSMVIIYLASYSVFELATPLVPEYFLPLASLGNLTKVMKVL